MPLMLERKTPKRVTDWKDRLPGHQANSVVFLQVSGKPGTPVTVSTSYLSWFFQTSGRRAMPEQDLW